MLEPVVIGRMCWLVRRRSGAPRQQVAGHVQPPAATVSKLEPGSMTMAVHHLDALAGASAGLEGELRDDQVPAWGGWQPHRIAKAIASGADERGYAVLWLGADPVESQAFYPPGNQFVAATKDCWLDEIWRRP